MTDLHSGVPGIITFSLRLADNGAATVDDIQGDCLALLGHEAAWYKEEPAHFIQQLIIEDRKNLVKTLRRIAIDRRPRTARVHLRLSAADGSIGYHVLLHASTIDGERPRVLKGILLDWSAEARQEAERMSFQDRLEQIQRRESLGLMASGIAHDFNNILSAIRGNAELIGPTVPPIAQPRIKRLLQAVDRAAGLVRQILAYAGRGNVERRPLDLSEEITQLVALIRPGQSADINFVLDLHEGVPQVVMDPAQFQQVATNLLVNAAESYQGRGGTVTVTLGLEGIQVVMRVADHGAGIDAAVLEHIFEPYFTTKPHGHGLGLAAVQGIVTAIGGSIHCSSQVGHGTIFTVKLPARLHISRMLTPLPETALTGDMVLVADDDEDVREATIAMLSEIGYTCVAADGGRACQRILSEKRNRISAVVLDCRMPDIDGVEVLKELRARGDRIPVILVSGMINVDHLGDILRDRRTRFLAKPFTKAQLSAVFDVMFGSSRLHHAAETNNETSRLVNDVIRTRAQDRRLF